MGSDPNDPNDAVQKLENRREQVRDADIPQIDKDALLAWSKQRRSETGAETAAGNLFAALKAARIAASNDMPPLADWELADFNHYNEAMNDHPDTLEGVPDGGYSHGYRRNIRQAIRHFAGHLGREWNEDVKIGKPSDTSVKRSDLLTHDEIQALVRTAEANARDGALVTLPLATWQRNASLRALRLGDVYLPGYDELPDDDRRETGYVTLNADVEEGNKRASGVRPLTWATAYVERWIDAHPHGPKSGNYDEDAPLLCVINDVGKADEGSALSRDHSYNRRLRTIAERAGLSEDRYKVRTGRKERTIGVHLMRHTAITRAGLMEGEDALPEATIKRWAGWTQDSDRLRTYLHTTDEDVMNAAESLYGDGDDDGETYVMQPDQCNTCQHPMDIAWMDECPRCGKEMTFEPPRQANTDELTTMAEEYGREMMENMIEGAIDRGMDRDEAREWLKDSGMLEFGGMTLGESAEKYDP